MQRRGFTIQDLLNGTVDLNTLPPQIMAQLKDLIGSRQLDQIRRRQTPDLDLQDGVAGLQFLKFGGTIFEANLIKFLEAPTDPNKPAASQSAKVEAFAMSILQESFETEDFNLLLQKLYENQTLGTGLCRKLLKAGKDVGYQCLDCQKDPTCIICSECFEKSNHVGHRVFLKQVVGGMCDCGDKDAWDVKGNCSDHQGFVKEDNVLPQKFKNKLTETLKQFFYTSLLAFEVLDKPSKRVVLNQLLKAVFESLMEFTQMYPTLTPVVCKALYTPLSTNGKKAQFYYAKDSIPGKFSLHTEPHETDVPVLAHLLRLSSRMEKGMVNKVKDFFLSLFVDHEFKKKFASIFVDYYHWLAPFDDILPGERLELSPLREINIQLLTSEELGYEAIKQGNMVEHIRGITLRLQKSCHTNKQFGMMVDILYFRHQLIEALENCLIKRQGVVYFFSQPDMVNELFGLLATIQNNQACLPVLPSPSDLTMIDKALGAQTEVELSLLVQMLQICPLLCLQPPADRLGSVVGSLKILKKLVLEQAQGDALVESKLASLKFGALVERTFICLLVGDCVLQEDAQASRVFFEVFDVQRFWRICEQVFQGQEGIQFWTWILKKMARLAGLYREITRKCWSKYSTILSDLKENYYSTSLFSIDLTGTQMAALYLQKKGEDWPMIYSNAYLNNKTLDESQNEPFSYLTQIAELPQNQASVVNDLFLSISEILTNDTAISFLIVPMKHKAKELGLIESEVESSSDAYKKPYEYFLKHFLTVVTPTPVKAFNESIVRYLPDNSMVQFMLGQISEFDKQSKQIRLKLEVFEKVKKSGINPMQIWYDSNLTTTFMSTATDKLHQHFSITTLLSSTPLQTPLVQSTDFLLSFLLTLGLQTSSLLQPELFETWGMGFSRLLGVTLAKDAQHIVDKQTAIKAVDQILADVLLVDNMLAVQNQYWNLAKERLLSTRHALLGGKEPLVSPSSLKQAIANSDEQHKMKMKELFLKKKTRVLSKYQELKQTFMVGLEKNSEKIVQGLTESNSDRTCPITQEKLSSDKTYYQFCYAHISNVDSCLT